MVNLLEPGDEAVICINGVFGKRLADIVELCGAKVIKVESDLGIIINPQDVKKALATCNPKILAIVHAETSTGVLQSLEEISKMTKNAVALLVVDAVTLYCGTDLKVDKWGIDPVFWESKMFKCTSWVISCYI